MTAIAAQTACKEKAPRVDHRHLALFFCAAYLAQGFSSQFGLIAQPVQFFMMKGLSLNAAQVASFLSIMWLPWVLKPAYALVADFVPFFGYRRKSYLVASSVLAAIALIGMTFSTSLPGVLFTLLLLALAMSISTALMVGMAVEAGRPSGKARGFLTNQALFYHCANVAAAICGGMLCQFLSAQIAFQAAAAIALVPVLIVGWLTIAFVKEEKTSFSRDGFNATKQALRQALSSRSFWLVAGLWWFWNFIPCFGVPLYFHQTNALHFSQSTIGQLSGCTAVGMVSGAIFYGAILKNTRVRTQLITACALLILSTVSYLFLNSVAVAIGLELCRGIATMVSLLALYGLAADICPKHIEVSQTAFLLAVRNLATEASIFTGGNLFTHVFHDAYQPLVILATLGLAGSAVLIPLLLKEHRRSVETNLVS